MFSGAHTSYAARSGIMFSERSEIETSVSFLLLPLSPRMANKMLLNKENRILVRMWLTTSAYSSPRLREISSANRLWYIVDSGPIPPVVEKIRGAKDPLSTCIILSLYVFFFSFCNGCKFVQESCLRTMQNLGASPAHPGTSVPYCSTVQSQRHPDVLCLPY